MSQKAKADAIAKIEGSIADARWAGLTDEQIQAVITVALLKRP